jgi:hypothetical protein
MGVTAVNLLLLVLATSGVVLGISFVTMLLLNKDIDAAER